MGQGVLSPGLLERIATEVGTPTFVYDLAAVRERVQRVRTALHAVPHHVHYAMKANANRAILADLKAQGCGVECVSHGELFRALRAGFTGADIVVGGVGKRRDELEAALDARVKLINVESEAELRLLAELATAKGVTADIGLRVNPEVESESVHHYIATGSKGHKFGIAIGDALAVARVALSLAGVRLIALDMHVGSQLDSFTAFRDATERLVELGHALRAEGAPLALLDVGGGLPIPYRDEPEADLNAYGAILRHAAHALGDCQILVEHGRFLVATSGTLLMRVLYRKESAGKTYIICDAAMTELIRPALYDAYHRIAPVGVLGEGDGDRGKDSIVADIVGPVCESGDFLALDRSIADVAPGALLAVHDVGAYGYVMSSQYNARPRAAEVAVDGSRWAVVTARETVEELVRLEAASPQWREG